MKNIILVEGKDDKTFIEHLANTLEVKEFAVQELGGDKDLFNRLGSLKNSFSKNPFAKLGIVIDHDNDTKKQRLDFVNKSLEATFGIQLPDTETFVASEIEGMSLQIACYFINVNGKGELETLLRLIKIQPSHQADCLEQWQNCLTEKVSPKEFGKLWIHYYIRYDTSSIKERAEAGKYCTLKYSLQEKQIWNINAPVLDNLKNFLAKFM